MAVGYIYVLTNPRYPEYVKVGFTKESAQERAKQLFTTGVPHPFRVEYFHLTDEVEGVEAVVHAELGKLPNARVNSDREFFKVEIAVAVGEIEKAVRAPQSRYLRAPLGPVPTRTCRACGHTYEVDPGARYTYCPRCSC
jgi:hypothetical protein